MLAGSVNARVLFAASTIVVSLSACHTPTLQAGSGVLVVTSAQDWGSMTLLMRRSC